jgi:chromosome partitioning protein
LEGNLSESANRKPQIIAVANQKGGVGKTTTTINVAAYLAKGGAKVLLCDLDPQGNTTSGLGIDKTQLKSSMYEVLINQAPVASAIFQTPYKNLYILPASSSLAAAEVELTRHNRREYGLQSALANLDYDYIFIDCPPSLGLLTLNGLVAATWLIIPAQAEYYALEGLGQLLQTIKRVRQMLNPKLRLLGVVVTMFDGRTSLGAQVTTELKKHFAGLVFDTRVPRNIRLAEAPSHGKPIAYYDRFCRGATAYKRLSKEIDRRVSQQ